MDIINRIEAAQLKEEVADFGPGDNVRVSFRIKEGDTERTQVFEGVVVARRGDGLREMFTVRKISHGVGVERTFPVHSPRIEKVEITRRGEVRRAKLYFLRQRIGRKARLKERGRQ